MVYLLLGTGFEEMEAVTPCDLLRRAGIEVKLIGVDGLQITGGHGITFLCDGTLEDVDLSAGEMILLPGGTGGVASIRSSEKALSLIQDFHREKKYVAAICAAPTILAQLHITDGCLATCYPGLENEMGQAVMVPETESVQDGRIITGTSAGCAIDFALQLITVLKGRDAADAVADAIVYRR
ncbi:MAG: DJ-1/PfpI family protein [Oscillospiraceae bacterium]|nr:DJ-1/PfpI family protein [Oscillospiraceae bacterium]